MKSLLLDLPYLGLLCHRCAGVRPKLRARLLIGWDAPETYPCTCHEAQR